jgi:Spy/CpxP family protein refolding chaperone
MKLERNLAGALVGVTAAIVLAGMGMPALAAPAMPLIDKGFEESLLKHFSKRFYNRIDASDEQRQRLSEILNKRANETRALREQVRAELVKINAMMGEDKTTDEQIVAETQVLKSLRDRLMDERVQSALQVRAALTSGQRAQISQRLNGVLTGDWKAQLAK